MREIVIREWCDACDQRGERSEATVVFTIAISESGSHGGSTRVLELCEIDAKAVRDVQRLSLERGVPPQAIMTKTTPPSKPGVQATLVQCPVCDAPEMYRSSLTQHLKTHHGAAAPPQPAVCADLVDGKPCGYETDSPQGMGAHRKASHGYDALAAAMASIGRDRGGATLTTTPRKRPAKP